MSEEVTKVMGLAELDKALKEFPAKMEQKILRGGLRAGAKRLEAIVLANVPVDEGDLKASIRTKTTARRGEVRSIVTAHSWKAKFIEFGTAEHFIKPKRRKSLFFAGLAREVVHHPGTAPNPFMRRALDTGQLQAVQATADYIRSRISKEKAKQ